MLNTFCCQILTHLIGAKIKHDKLNGLNFQIGSV